MSELAATATARLPCHLALKYRTSLATHLATVVAETANSDTDLHFIGETAQRKDSYMNIHETIE